MVPLTGRMLLLAAFVGLAAGHFNLINPKPYSPPLTHCKRNECHGPCPPLRTGAGKSSSHPSVTWRRGQKVDIAWQRNNHVGGYYRRSLVPVKHMFNSAWHEKTAFEWGCQSQNRYQCAKKPPKGKPAKKGRCGGDIHGLAYRNKMTVPKTFPDGVYVFSMLWFGGLEFTHKKAKFNDYYTCAYVRIHGGPLAGKHVPTFVRGSNPSKIKPGTCESTSARVGECAGFPCHGKPVSQDVPGVFRNGRKPPSVLLKDISKAVNEGSNSEDKCTGMSYGPQPPTKMWGQKGSVTYKMKAKQFQVWNKHCKKKGNCHCWK